MVLTCIMSSIRSGGEELTVAVVSCRNLSVCENQGTRDVAIMRGKGQKEKETLVTCVNLLCRCKYRQNKVITKEGTVDRQSTHRS